jgi:hypothetical protein
MKRAVSGKAIKMPINIIRDARNGTRPRKMTYIGTSLTIPEMMNTFMPIGGVIRANSHITTNIIPNQMKS